MNNLPSNFVIDFTQVLDLKTTVRVIVILGFFLWAAMAKGSGMDRAGKILLFGFSIHVTLVLAACSGPDDSIISQSKTQQAQIQANAEQQQQQALAQAQQNLQAQQAQAQQATALQVAQAEAAIARDDAQKQQAEALAQQARANQLQAVTMSDAIAALDNANQRASGTTTILLVSGLIVVFSVIGALLYFRTVEKVQGQNIVVSRYDNMTGPQLLEAARQAGYLVTKDEAGKWAIVDRSSLKRLNKKQLLLELKG